MSTHVDNRHRPGTIASVKQGDVIHVVPEVGPERVMLVSHVEHYVITLAEVPLRVPEPPPWAAEKW